MSEQNPFIIRYWARAPLGGEHECRIDQHRGGPIIRCGKCFRGVVGREKGGLHGHYCLVCGSSLRASKVFMQHILQATDIR